MLYNKPCTNCSAILSIFSNIILASLGVVIKPNSTKVRLSINLFSFVLFTLFNNPRLLLFLFYYYE